MTHEELVTFIMLLWDRGDDTKTIARATSQTETMVEHWLNIELDHRYAKTKAQANI